MINKKSNKQIGNYGEEAAAKFLQKSGFKILERNYRYSRLCEIDIIAKNKDTIVFVEVKTRTSTSFGHPFEAINKSKLSNVFKAGLFYLQNTQESYKNYRIDIISVIGNINDKNPKIEHLKNVSLN